MNRAWWVLPLVVGCTEGGPQTPDLPDLQCADEAADEVLVSWRTVGGMLETGGEGLLYLDAHRFFRVWGDCSYQIYDSQPYPVGHWVPIRQGQLDTDELKLHVSALLGVLQDVDDLEHDHCQTPAPDAPTDLFQVAGEIQRCPGAALPEDLRDASLAAFDALDAAATEQAVPDEVRVHVGFTPRDPGDDAEVIAWPFTSVTVQEAFQDLDNDDYQPEYGVPLDPSEWDLALDLRDGFGEALASGDAEGGTALWVQVPDGRVKGLYIRERVDHPDE